MIWLKLAESALAASNMLMSGTAQCRASAGLFRVSNRTKRHGKSSLAVRLLRDKAVQRGDKERATGDEAAARTEQTLAAASVAWPRRRIERQPKRDQARKRWGFQPRPCIRSTSGEGFHAAPAVQVVSWR